MMCRAALVLKELGIGEKTEKTLAAYILVMLKKWWGVDTAYAVDDFCAQKDPECFIAVTAGGPHIKGTMSTSDAVRKGRNCTFGRKQHQFL